MSKNGRKQATIWLGYFKQGDDLDRCIVKDDDGDVNTKETLNNHIKLLEAVIEKLKSINDLIPDVNTCSLYGDTHYISIEGDERIIDQLVSHNLAQIDENMDEPDEPDGPNELNDSDNSDTSNEDKENSNNND